MKIVSHLLKEIGNGALRAIGALLVALLSSWLIARLPAVKQWALEHSPSPEARGIIGLTIFLAALCVALLGLWIWSQIALYKLKKRVQNKSLTLHDILGEKQANKAIEDLSKSVGDRDNPWMRGLR